MTCKLNYGKNKTRSWYFHFIISLFYETRCFHTAEFFLPNGTLRNIDKLKFWPVLNVLTEKYDWDFADAAEFADLLSKMLHLNPSKRATAEECLQHPWLNDEATFDVEGYRKYLQYDKFARGWPGKLNQVKNKLNSAIFSTLSCFLLVFLFVFVFFLQSIHHSGTSKWTS